MNLTQLGKFDILTYLKVNFSLIIYYLTYLTFLVNLCNQLLQSIFCAFFYLNIHLDFLTTLL